MNAGDLRHSVTLQQKSSTRSGIGEQVVTWTDVATVRARAVPLRGRELFAASQYHEATDTRFETYYRSDVTQTMRLLWRGQPYDIVGVINVDGMDREMHLMCVSGLHDGR
jgi:SPP1 family predicted phage head-tail adaptor